MPGARRRGRRLDWAAGSASCTLSLETGRADAVQSGDRRHGQGPSRSRDRCARRIDGPRDRRDGHPVQAAESEPRSGGVVAARAGGQAGYGAWMRDALSSQPGISGSHARRSGPGRTAGVCPDWSSRTASAVAAGPRRDDRHVPERTRARRRRAATGRARQRTAERTSCRVAAVVRVEHGTSQDRHSTAARSSNRSTSRSFPRSPATIRSCRSRS